MNELKIAFGYKMGTGKDTAVNYLVDVYGGKRISFASPLYDILHHAQTIAGFPIEKDRKFLQWVGTEWGRTKDNNVWVNAAINKITTGNSYITDLRFANEFRACKANGIICVKMTRDTVGDRKGSGTTTHSSENELDNIPDDEWDYIIDNNGTTEDLFPKLHHIVKKILV